MELTTLNTVSHFNESTSQDILKSVNDDGINLAIWKRSIDLRCDKILERMLCSDEVTFIDTKPNLKEDIFQSLGESIGYELSPSVLAQDIWTLHQLFCQITSQDYARVRLYRIEDDMCQLFHADSLQMRMLCTYVGRGTEWVENHNARYDQLGSQGRTKEETNAAIVINSHEIHTMQPWHVGVFTGRKKRGISPLIHRSPSVLNKRDHRIFLCIDDPDACGCS